MQNIKISSACIQAEAGSAFCHSVCMCSAEKAEKNSLHQLEEMEKEKHTGSRRSLEQSYTEGIDEEASSAVCVAFC